MRRGFRTGSSRPDNERGSEMSHQNARRLPPIFLAFLPALSGAAVVTDGTLGARGPVGLSGGIYSIPASLGQTRGPNLFHSFSQLDLTQGQTASFSGPSSIQNVLARVTGGAASSIDGTLQCTIPGANFYLINPAGVMFGPN